MANHDDITEKPVGMIISSELKLFLNKKSKNYTNGNPLYTHCLPFYRWLVNTYGFSYFLFTLGNQQKHRYET